MERVGSKELVKVAERAQWWEMHLVMVLVVPLGMGWAPEKVKEWAQNWELHWVKELELKSGLHLD
jgi:hypothetical protein